MMKRPTHILWLVLLALALGACPPPGPASAATAPIQEAVIVLGTLTCSLGGEPDTASVGQGRSVLCRFRPGSQGAEETYVGSMQGVGQTKTLFGRGTMMLAVKGPASTALASGLLQQTYEADATTSGASTAPLIGARNRSIVLQSLTEEEGRVAAGKTQSDAVVILIELKLEASPA
jgi:Protein of unknown function (DUF992)